MSVQQDRYLQARADGATMMTACVQSGIPISEARLIDLAIARGELDLPSPAAGQAVQSKGELPMARKTKPGDQVTNVSESKDTVRNSVPRIVNLKKQRKEINAEIAAEREKVNAAGIPKAALDHAIRVLEMDPEVRTAFDEGVAIARDAVSVPMSRSLFDMLDERTGPAPANQDTTEDAAA